MITGESIPIDKVAGDTVISATINKNGSLQIKATKLGEETPFAQIVKVTVKETSKVAIERMRELGLDVIMYERPMRLHDRWD